MRPLHLQVLVVFGLATAISGVVAATPSPILVDGAPPASSSPSIAPSLADSSPLQAEPPPMSLTASATMAALVGLLAVAGVAWRKRRSATPAGCSDSLDIIAQVALGGRARAVWLRAGRRHMVVAVTPQVIQILDQWNDASTDNEDGSSSRARSSELARRRRFASHSLSSQFRYDRYNQGQR